MIWSRHYSTLSLAAALLLPSLRAAAAPTPLPSPVLPDGLGVNIHFTDPRPGEMKMLAAGGFKWVRMDFAWGGIEKTRGVYDFAAYDRLLAALEPYHIRAVFILDYGNDLYNKGESPRTEEGRQAFARWATASARHFAGKGILWEMFNEPNIGFWKPKPDVNEYIPLALAVGKALREAAPGETYIGPATSTLDFPFLEACLKAGLLEYWSAVSVHPYRGGGPETAAPEFQRLRLLIDKYAPHGKIIPIISGEWGYASPGGPTDEDHQGKMLPRQWLSNLSNNIALSIWYDWHEDGLDPKDPEHHFGTVRNPYHPGRDPVYDPKPAYVAAKTLTDELDGFRFSKRLWTGSEDDYVLVFSKGRDVRIAAWTTSPTPHKLALPAAFGPLGVFDHLDVRPGDWVNPPASEQLPGEIPHPFADAPEYLHSQNNRGFLQPEALPFLRIAAAWDRAPLELIAHAPSQVRVSLSLRNPLDKTITVTTDTGKVRVDPHAIHFFVQTVDITRAPGPLPVLLNLNVDGLGTVTQRTEIIVANPLSAMALPREGDILPVDIENSSGEAFTGTVKVVGAGGEKPWSATLPIQLKAGQVEQTLRFPIPAGNGGDYGASLAVIDNTGKTLLSVPTARFHLIDDFSRYPSHGQPGGYTVIPDGDPKVGSEQTITLEAPADGPTPAGAGALKLTYRFDEGWKFVRVITNNLDLDKIEGKPRALGLWIYGDGQGASPRIRFKDSTLQTFQPAAPSITWKGWRYVMFPMDGKDGGHWGGANDGVIHYPIQLDTLFLLDGDRKATRGAIYLSAPTWIW